MTLSVCLLACNSSRQNYAPVVDAWRQPIDKQGVHRVEPGETLYSIAWRYGFDYREVAKINGIPAPYALRVGQKISLVEPSAKNASKSAYTPSRSAALPKHKPAAPQSGPSSVKQTAKKTESAPIANSHSTKAVAVASGLRWHWPVQGKVIGRYTATGIANKGIDIAANKGAPVYATAAGEVVYSGNGLFGYGNLIIIKHNSEYLSAYAHNSKILVIEGQSVSAQQKIAEVGDSG